MVGIILIQKSEGGIGLGTGSGGGQGMFTARGTANFLTHATAVLAGIFFLNCLLMTHLTKQDIKEHTSIIQKKN